MSQVVLGFVGSGKMGQLAHIANYATDPNVQLRGIADLKVEQAQAVADKYGIEKAYGSVDELLADSSIDAVVVTLPYAQNRNVAVRCLAAGKHVVTEKPLAGCIDDAQAIVSAAEKAGKHACVGYMKCYDAGVEYAQNVVANWATVPELVHVHFGGGDWIRNSGLTQSIRTQEGAKPDPALSAPSDLTEEAQAFFKFCANQHTHHLGLLRFLLSHELKLETVTRHGQSHSALFTSGDTLVNLEYSPLKAEWWEESAKVYWPDGYLDLKTPSPLLRNVPAQVRVYKHNAEGGGEFVEPSIPASWSFQRAAQHFVRVVQGEEAPRVPAELGLRDIVLCDAMARAARFV